jgi:WD40 repeat protein
MNTIYLRGIVLLLSLLLFACGQDTDSVAPNNNTSQSTRIAEPPAAIHRKPVVIRHVITNELAQDNKVKPFRTITIDGDILDLVVSGMQLLVASNGFFEVYNLENFERTRRQNFEKIENFYGDLHLPRVFSADMSPSGEQIVFVKETAGGKSVVQLQEASNLTTLITENANLAIRKIRFLDENRLLMATIESEVILFDLNDLAVSYKHQLSLSSFSDFSINLENHQVALADESGVIPYFGGDHGKIDYLLKGGNLDKIFDIDLAKKRIITGGKDRSVSIYNLESGVVDKYLTDFYIYAVALDENAEQALFILDEDNHVGLFDIKAEELTAILHGDGKSLGFLTFISDHQALGATYNQIFLWSFR